MRPRNHWKMVTGNWKLSPEHGPSRTRNPRHLPISGLLQPGRLRALEPAVLKAAQSAVAPKRRASCSWSMAVSSRRIRLLRDRSRHYCAAHAGALSSPRPCSSSPAASNRRTTRPPSSGSCRRSTRRRSAGTRTSSAIGGGAVLDVVGYAAATAHRGIRLIRVPTTVLAQDDSAVGVKNGINAFGKKNYLGTFAPPFAVINDFELPDHAVGSGLARRRVGGGEGRAHQGPRRSSTFSRSARPRSSARDWPRWSRSCADRPRCTCSTSPPAAIRSRWGSSRPLDFGHWAAHKLEQLSSHRCGMVRRSRSASPSTPLTRTWRACCPRRTGGASSRSSGARAAGLRAGARPASRHAEHPAVRAARARRIPRAPRRRLTVMMLRAIGEAFDAHEIDNGMFAHRERRAILRRFAGDASAGLQRTRMDSARIAARAPRELVDEYFIENRSGCSRSRRFSIGSTAPTPRTPQRDFRMQAFSEALAALPGPDRLDAHSAAAERPDDRAARRARSQGRHRRLRSVRSNRGSRLGGSRLGGSSGLGGSGAGTND